VVGNVDITPEDEEEASYYVHTKDKHELVFNSCNDILMGDFVLVRPYLKKIEPMWLVDSGGLLNNITIIWPIQSTMVGIFGEGKGIKHFTLQRLLEEIMEESTFTCAIHTMQKCCVYRKKEKGRADNVLCHL
jgi:hypothetical protein